MAYTTIDDPTLYFSSTIWTGNGVDDRAIVIDGTGMQPDFVWIKSRNDTDNHRLVDSVRGATKHLESDGTGAEQTSSNVKAFTSTGVTLSTNGSVNANSELYASWSWKAGTSFTNDASATGIGTIDSTGSVSDASGFSIVSYTGTGSAGTIKHGLSAAPNFMIVKNRDAARSWNVYFGDPTDYMYLNDTAAAADYNEIWNDTAPTTSVFSVGTDNGVNQSGEKYIAYIFAEKQGYSKFGSYVGNGSASSGTFTYLGFKPSLIILKRTDSTADWKMYDNKRNSGSITNGNPNGRTLKPNSSAAEGNAELLDFLSNGFKHYNDNGTDNESGASYIYMAFASNPFVTSTGVPACAR